MKASNLSNRNYYIDIVNALISLVQIWNIQIDLKEDKTVSHQMLLKDYWGNVVEVLQQTLFMCVEVKRLLTRIGKKTIFEDDLNFSKIWANKVSWVTENYSVSVITEKLIKKD